MFLKRYGVSSKYNNNFLYNLIDDLEYTYSGNQLKTVDDHAEEEESVFFEGVADFKDRSNASKQYFYDANGNMTKDLNKGIDTIRYNLLNLPQEIVFANGDRSLYKYNAAGIKYQVTHYTYLDTELNPIQGNGVAMYDTLTYDYDGSYVYRDHYFNMLMTPDGYVHIGDIIPENCFYAKDHLGNNRATYSVTPMSELGVLVKDINNYYPFGMEFNEKPVVFNVGFNPELDFTYNGKESQTMHGLNMMDYGARFIDMANPGWIGVDPLAEKYYSIRPYAYCGGNPVRFIDIDGKEPGDIIILFTGADFGQGPTSTTSDMLKALSNHNSGETVIQYSSLYYLSQDNGIKNAYNEIVSNYKANPDGKIIIYGYSYGGILANELSKKLEKQKISVELLITVDAANGWGSNSLDRDISNNVKQNDNFYEQNTNILSDATLSHGDKNTGQKGQVNNTDLSNKTFKGDKINHMNIDNFSAPTITNKILNVMSRMQESRKTLSREEIKNLFQN